MVKRTTQSTANGDQNQQQTNPQPSKNKPSRGEKTGEDAQPRTELRYQNETKEKQVTSKQDKNNKPAGRKGSFPLDERLCESRFYPGAEGAAERES